MSGAYAADRRGIFDWLVDGAPGAGGSAQIVDHLGARLVGAGIPVDRIAAFVRTLHPHIMGRSFTWRPGQPVDVREASYALLNSDVFRRSPMATVFETGRALRRRIVDPACPRDFAVLDELAADGVTDYIAVPLTFLSGQSHGISFATVAPGGFSEEHIAALLDIARPLSRLAEILALGRTSVNLLDTYVGRNAGERIMGGKIQRGDIDGIRAVIWFSDLRGFTALAGTLEPPALIGMLNDLFECQVPAIERHGGEVLKFMGDGLFAIFAVEGEARAPGVLCDAALDAATDAHTALAALNQARAARGETPMRFGLALHVGDIAYGNIGGAGRLDFTCIGPAVNVASRLEGLTGKVGRPVLLSAEFARLTSRPVSALGTFELKGVAQPQEVFAPTGVEALARW